MSNTLSVLHSWQTRRSSRSCRRFWATWTVASTGLAWPQACQPRTSTMPSLLSWATWMPGHVWSSCACSLHRWGRSWWWCSIEWQGWTTLGQLRVPDFQVGGGGGKRDKSSSEQVTKSYVNFLNLLFTRNTIKTFLLSAFAYGSLIILWWPCAISRMLNLNPITNWLNILMNFNIGGWWVVGSNS